MHISTRSLRKVHDEEQFQETGEDAALWAMLPGLSQWRKGARCRDCEFLERHRLYGGTAVWRCISAWRSYRQVSMWAWFRLAKAEGYYLPCDKLRYELVPYAAVATIWDYPRLEVNPGSFACWLFRPGETLSAHYWRDDKWAEYLALRALAGGEPFAQKPG